MRMVLFAFVSLVIQCLLHYYLWRRLVKDTGLRPPWRRLATGVLIFFGAAVPVTFASSRIFGSSIGLYLGWPVFLWLGLIFLLFVGLLCTDLVRFWMWSVRFGHAALRSRRAPAISKSRRLFFAQMAGATVVTGAAGASAWGLYQTLKKHEVTEVPITLSRLPRAMDGFTIAQITDVHVGYTVTRAFVQRVVDQVNALRPDLIVITGDLVDGDAESLADIVEPVAELDAPHGVYFVTGNHEYYAGVDSWLEVLGRLGVRVLRNERVSIGDDRASFDLAGVDDFQAAGMAPGHGPDLKRALADRDPGRELVLLAHQPRHVFEAKKHGVGLQLSGHTHGGQIWPWHYFVRAQQRGLLSGWSKHRDTQLYISRGTGYWGPPIRVGAPAEIAKIILRSA